MPQAQPCLSSCMFQRKEAAYRSILPAHCSGFQCHKPSPFTYIRTRTVRRFSENNEQEEAKKKSLWRPWLGCNPQCLLPQVAVGKEQWFGGERDHLHLLLCVWPRYSVFSHHSLPPSLVAFPSTCMFPSPLAVFAIQEQLPVPLPAFWILHIRERSRHPLDRRL